MRLASRLAGLVAFVLLARPVVAEPDDGTAEARRIARVVRVAELWGEIKFRHPVLATSELDWDAALLAALPKVEAAPDAAAYAAAVQEMLARLGDPVTRVLGPERPASPLTHDPRPFRRWERDDVLVLRLRSLAEGDAMQLLGTQASAAMADVKRARAVVVDARLGGVSGASLDATSRAFRILLDPLVDAPLVVPGQEYVLHSGYAPQNGRGREVYASAIVSEAATIITPKPAPRPRRLTFIVDERSPELSAILALRAAGKARILAEGPVTDEALVSTMEVDLGEGRTARLRTSRLGVALAFDAQVPAGARGGGQDPALERAVALAAAVPPGHAEAPAPAVRAPPIARVDDAYPQMTFPPRAHRQLAAIRFWTVIRLFYPYLDLLDAPWEGALARFLPRFEGATDAEAYVRAVLEMAAAIDDAHTHVSGHEALARWLPEGWVPVDLLELDGKPVIVGERFPGAVPRLPVGGIVETVDGEPFTKRVARLEPLVAGATPAHKRWLVLHLALRGPTESTAVLGIREASGALREVRLARRGGPAPMAEGAPPWRILPGNVGYASLVQLRPDQVDGMFAALRDTRALILDLRGYPRGTFWSLAPYLNAKGDKLAALFERPIVSRYPERESLKFPQTLPPAREPPYRGRVAVLIDERAISQAEHTGLWLETLTDVTFVGSPTAGSNGDVTSLTLPGGIAISFTGHDVRHADGRQLQRVGLQPHVPVRPTIAGLAAGRDEVLERALEVLAPPSRGAVGSGSTTAR